MEKKSLVERLTAYLKKNPDTWYHKGDLAKLAESVGYMGETCGRRLREMTEDKILESRENSKGHVEYRYKPQRKEITKVEVKDGIAYQITETVYT